MSAAVVAAGLGHAFHDEDMLFQGLDFTVSSGEVVALCGPSGSGKSTLLSIIATWVQPTHGSIEHRGVRRVGWVFQNPFGVPGRSALDHVSFPLLAAGCSRAVADEQALEIMALFGLSAVIDRPFKALSGGESQRLMLARAVALAPDVLLVDEPTAQLDLRTAETVNATLANLAVGGGAVIVATHDPRTRAACSSVIDLDRGSRGEQA